MEFYIVYYDKDVDVFISRYIYCDIVQLSSNKKNLLFYLSDVLVESISIYDIFILDFCRC